MAVKKLKEFLNTHHVKYVTISHSPAFTAQQVAESAHVPGKEMAKTLIVKLDGKMVMVVLPSNIKLDLYEMQERVGAHKAELASEHEFKDKFTECELGAMPPFGNLFGMDVYLDDRLTKNKDIAFNAGTHSEVMKLAMNDFTKLVQPRTI